MSESPPDPDAREQIIQRFYDCYLEGGLRVIVNAYEEAKHLGLDPAQARRCIDYLSDSGLIRPMTLAGGYSPTVTLVDHVEQAKGDRV